MAAWDETRIRAYGRVLLLVGAALILGFPLILAALGIGDVTWLMVPVAVVLGAVWCFLSVFRDPGTRSHSGWRSWINSWTGLVRFRGRRAPGSHWMRRALAATSRHQAERYLRKAAAQGHPEADFELGLFHLRSGLGVVAQELACHCFRQAAQRGHVEAAFRYAEALRWGSGAPKDPKGAMPWYERAARAGFGPAAQWLAQAYARGEGVEPDPRRAEAWQRVASQTGSTPLRDSALISQPDPSLFGEVGQAARVEALDHVHSAWGWVIGRGWFWPVLSGLVLVILFITIVVGRLPILGIVQLTLYTLILLGLAGVAYQWLVANPSGARRSRSFARLRTMAEGGDPEACLTLGRCYATGHAEAPQDFTTARRWLLPAAQAGHAEAMILLADLLAWGKGGPRDATEARSWLQQAQAKGHPEAEVRLRRLAADPESAT